MPYTGTFYLELDGASERVPLTAFGGCFDNVLARAYEDCYFSTRVFAPLLLGWLDDTISRRALYRSLVVYQTLLDGTIQSKTAIDDAFLREFSVADLEATSAEFVTVNFVVVPAQIRTTTASGTVSTFAPKFLRRNAFTTAVNGVQLPSTAMARGLSMVVPKLPAPPITTYAAFSPGLPTFGPLGLEVGPHPSVADLDAWVQQASQGTTPAKEIRIDLLDASGNLEQVIYLQDVVPAAFPPYATGGTRRMFLAQYGALRIQ